MLSAVQKASLVYLERMHKYRSNGT